MIIGNVYNFLTNAILHSVGSQELGFGLKRRLALIEWDWLELTPISSRFYY